MIFACSWLSASTRSPFMLIVGARTTPWAGRPLTMESEAVESESIMKKGRRWRGACAHDQHEGRPRAGGQPAAGEDHVGGRRRAGAHQVGRHVLADGRGQPRPPAPGG